MSSLELRGLIHLPFAHTTISHTTRCSVHQVILCVTKAQVAHCKGNTSWISHRVAGVTVSVVKVNVQCFFTEQITSYTNKVVMT